MVLPLGAIWSVEYYVNQDGSLHLYNAYLILEILKGNQAVSQFVTFSPVLVPNLTGHWILAGLLSIFSAAVATKVFVSLLFAGLVASMCWLRQQVSGRENAFTGLLLSVVLAFNWMWFLGLYNFILGAIGFALTLGLWWKWREAFTWGRSAVIALLVLFVFFSHLITACALVFSLFVLSLAGTRHSSTTVIRTGCAVLPMLPFLISYLRFGAARAVIAPTWGYLTNPWSLSSWFAHLQSADPFQLVSRRSLPFVEIQTRWFALASPTLWLVVALCCLAAATLRAMKQQPGPQRRTIVLWSGLALFFGLVWLAGPDGFGVSHGWFLRERCLLLGLICLTAILRVSGRSTFLRVAHACLMFGIVFQSAVLWQYSRYASGEALQLMAARDHISDTDSFGSLVVNRGGCQFKAIPRVHLTAFMAVGRDFRLWDNAELRSYLFPIVVRDDEDRRWFARREMTGVNLCPPAGPAPSTFNRLDELLQTHYDRVNVLLVWGRDERVDEVVGHWYESQPFYESDDVRLFRRR
jgi:hypothetical protein